MCVEGACAHDCRCPQKPEALDPLEVELRAVWAGIIAGNWKREKQLKLLEAVPAL